jgi:hypothetical protein
MDEKIAGQENFNLPHDVVTLPSEGIFYKNKKKSIKVGFLTASDENILATLSSNSLENIITNLLRSKIYEPDIKIDEMIPGDVEAVMIFLRNTSFGYDYTLSVIDPVTRKEFETTLDLSELDFKKINQKPNENGFYDVQLPKSGASVKLKILTYGETKELTKMEESYPKGMVTPKITWRLMKQIQEVNGNQSKETISKFIDTLPISDSKFIRDFLNDIEPGLDLKRQVIAPSGEKVTVQVSFGVDFFRPFF